MQYVIPFDLTDGPEGDRRHVLTGPESGFPECQIACCRTAPVSSPQPLASLPLDRLLFVLSGEISVRCGSGPVRLQPRSLLRIPRGIPHGIGSAGDLEATWIEIRAQARPRPEQARESGATGDLRPLVRRSRLDDGGAPGAGFEYTFLASRALGSDGVAVNIARVQPGHRGPDYHIHTFDQFYCVLQGRLTVDIGFRRYEVAAPALVILPAGTVHRQRNEGDCVEEHLAILCPEPPEGEPLDHQIAMPPAPAAGA